MMMERHQNGNVGNTAEANVTYDEPKKFRLSWYHLKSKEKKDLSSSGEAALGKKLITTLECRQWSKFNNHMKKAFLTKRSNSVLRSIRGSNSGVSTFIYDSEGLDPSGSTTSPCDGEAYSLARTANGGLSHSSPTEPSYDKSAALNCLHLLCMHNAPVHIILSVLKHCPSLASEPDKKSHRLPLHFAAACGLPSIVTRALLTSYPEGAIHRDNIGRTPLIAACQSQSSGLVDVPTSTRGRGSRSSNSERFLDLTMQAPGVAQYGLDYGRHYQIVKELISQVPLNGVNIVDKFELSALQYAINTATGANSAVCGLKVSRQCHSKNSYNQTRVVAMLQTAVAIESKVTSELRNTKRKTNLPQSIYVIEEEKIDLNDPFGIQIEPIIRKKITTVIRWRPMMIQPPREFSPSVRSNPNRRAIYERMGKIQIGNGENEVFNNRNRGSRGSLASDDTYGDTEKLRSAMISFMGLTDDVAKEGDSLSRTKSTQSNSHIHGNGLGGKKMKNGAKGNDHKDFVFDSPFLDNIPMIIDLIQDEKGGEWESLSTSQKSTKRVPRQKRKKKKKSRHSHYDKVKTLKDFDDENLLTSLTDNAHKKTESLEARIKMKASEAICTKQAANAEANANNLNDEERTTDTDEESYGRHCNNSQRSFTFDVDANNLVDLKDVSKDVFDEAYAKRFSFKEIDSLTDPHVAFSRMKDGDKKVKASLTFDNDKDTKNSIDELKDDSDFVEEMNTMEIDSRKDETEEASGEKNSQETTDGEKTTSPRQAAEEQGDELTTSRDAQIYTEVQFESEAKDEDDVEIQSNDILDDEADAKLAKESKDADDEIAVIPVVEENISQETDEGESEVLKNK